MGITAIKFNETDHFYKRLDKLVADGETVHIEMGHQKLSKKSPLWKRFGRAANWNTVKRDLTESDTRVQGKLWRTVVDREMRASMADGGILTGWFLAFVAGCIASVLLYGMYKGKKITLKVTGGGVIIVVE